MSMVVFMFPYYPYWLIWSSNNDSTFGGVPCKYGQAVGIAKDHIRDIFSDETIERVGLEEIEFDDLKSQWRITIGFVRYWKPEGLVPRLSNSGSSRTYKLVLINDADGNVVSVRHRDSASA